MAIIKAGSAIVAKAKKKTGKKVRPPRKRRIVRKSARVSPAVRARAVKDMVRSVAPLLDALSDSAYFKDVDGRYLVVNGAFVRLAKRPKARILGKTDTDIFPADMAEKCRTSDFKLFKERKPLRTEEVMLKKKGVVVFDTLKGPVLDKKCGVLGLIGISRDISKYRKTAEELKTVSSRLSMVVADAPIVLFTTDANGIFTLSEGKGLKELGLKSGETVGKSAFELYAHNPVIVECLRHALAGKTLVREFPEADRVYEMHLSPLKNIRGEITGLIGVAIDVTDRVQSEKDRISLLEKEKRMRAEAERISRSKDDFLALLSHELRTPMTAMIGWTWLLRAKDLGTKDFNMAVDTIERNMKAQAQIIEDLLDISHISSGKMRIESVRVDLRNILRSAVDIVMPAAEARSISVHLDDDLPALEVSGDPERLQQAVWNLMSNAVKFTPESGKVRISLKRMGNTADISIRDNGLGIALDYLPHVFEMFTQQEDTMTREHRGLGLGLAIIKHIVEMHGGTVSVHSEGEGKGSEFMISLPLLSRKKKEASGPAASYRGGARRSKNFPDLAGVHVLIVEDEPDARTVLTVSLEHCGAKVTAVASAAEAFDFVRFKRPDVIISDIAMPGEDGFSLIRRIRDLSKDEGSTIPAAALTGRTGPEDRAQALMSGYQMYIIKPVEPVELAYVVQSLAKLKSA